MWHECVRLWKNISNESEISSGFGNPSVLHVIKSENPFLSCMKLLCFNTYYKYSALINPQLMGAYAGDKEL